MFWRASIFVMLIGVCSLPESRAIRGKMVNEAKDIPAVVLVEGRREGSEKISLSSGCLIAPNVVLTAAHGVEGWKRFRITAPYAGEQPITVKSERAIVHPNYRRGEFDHDIAVVILDEAIAINGKLPQLYDGKLLRIDTPVTVVGRVQQGELSRTQMFRASTEIVNFPGNLNLYGGFPQTVEQGDSGGPIFADTKYRMIVAIITGMREFSRRDVERDAYLPINRKLRDWLMEQVKTVMP